MGDSAKTYLLVYILVFWLLLTLLSNLFAVSLSNSRINDFNPQLDEIEEPKGIMQSIFGTLDNIPLIKYISPILKIMTFQYSDEIPIYLSLILNTIAIITFFVVISYIPTID